MSNEQEFKITNAEYAIIDLWRYMQGLYRFCDYPGCVLPKPVIEEYKQKMQKELEKENSSRPSKEMIREKYGGEFKEINKWLKHNGLPQIEGIKKKRKKN